MVDPAKGMLAVSFGRNLAGACVVVEASDWHNLSNVSFPTIARCRYGKKREREDLPVRKGRGKAPLCGKGPALKFNI